MKSVFGSLFAFLASFFKNLNGATKIVDNLVDEAISASDVSLRQKFQEHQNELDKLTITEEQVIARRKYLHGIED